MIALLLIRHGRTQWNEQGRIQGHRDMPLSAAGRRALEGLRAPAPWLDGLWYSSPLARATETARLLGAPKLELEERLKEMDWGEWEGARLAELRLRFGGRLAENEARGLDFRPTGGESPREVCVRLASWIQELKGGAQRPVVAVTHKGVIRAMLSLATGWDMSGRFAQPLDWRCGHAFAVNDRGLLEITRLNVALGGAEQSSQ